MALRLRASTLGDLGGAVAVPGYARSQVSVGIVHFGVGAFHRPSGDVPGPADDRRLRWTGASAASACCPATGRSGTSLQRRTASTRWSSSTPDGTWEPRVIGSLVDYLFAPDEPGAGDRAARRPATRIVSLTDHRGRLQLQPGHRRVRRRQPGRVHRPAAGAAPETVFGLVTEALRPPPGPRHQPPSRSCPATTSSTTGDWHARCSPRSPTARPGLAGLDASGGLLPELAWWTASRPPPRRRTSTGCGLTSASTDGWPVVCEPFTQWVLEDDFPAGRPDWSVGVQLVDGCRAVRADEAPAAQRGHQALAYFGYLMGYRFVDEAARDPLFADSCSTTWSSRRPPPRSRPVPGIDLATTSPAIERFSNPAIRDTLARLARERPTASPSSSLPTVRNLAAAAATCARAASSPAGRDTPRAWTSRAPIEVVDPLRRS